MKTRVMCFGTFDILHVGHLKFLERAAALGDELFVVVSRDERRRAVSGERPINTQRDRMKLVGALRVVTIAIAGHPTDMLDAIKKYRPHAIALGHDQVYGIDALMTWIDGQHKKPRVVRIAAFRRDRYATSHTKQRLCLPR